MEYFVVLSLILILVLIFSFYHIASKSSIPGPDITLWQSLVMTYKFIYEGVPVAAKYYTEKYGRVVRVWLIGAPTLVITDRDVANHILVKNVGKYITRFGDINGLKAIGMYKFGVIWNNDADMWHQIRKHFDQAVKSRFFPNVIKYTNQYSEEFIHKVGSGKKIDILNELRLITLKLTLKLMFGDDSPRGISHQELIDSIVDYFKAWEYFLLRPMFLWFLPWEILTYRRHVKAVNRAQRNARTLINYYKTHIITDSGGEFFQALANDNLTDDNLIQCVIEMLIAGTDTSSVTMYYTLVCLSRNPDVLYDLLAEINAISADLSKLGDLQVLNKVLYESMRIKPVGPVIMRKAEANDTIHVKLSTNKTVKYKLKKGDNVIINIAGMNLDPDHYNNPFEFDLNNISDVKKQIPFGLGKKGCVGRDLAMIEMKAFFCTVLPRLNFKSNNTITAIESHWDIANQPVSNEMMYIEPRTRKIFLSGAHSVGKTTLIKEIKRRCCGIGIITELGRETLEQMGMDRKDLNDIKKRKSYQKVLLQRQIDEYNSKSYHNVILYDRSIVDNLAYSRKYVCEEFYRKLSNRDDVKRILNEYKAYHHFLIKPQPQFIHDDLKRMVSTIEELEELNDTMKRILEEHKIKYHIIEATSLDERVNIVLVTANLEIDINK